MLRGFFSFAKTVLIKNPDDQLKLFKGIILRLLGVNDINKLKSAQRQVENYIIIHKVYFQPSPPLPKKYIKLYISAYV